MTSAEELQLADFDEVYDRYLDDDDPHSTRDDWRRMFELSLNYGDQCGFKLCANGKLVGMLGAVFSRRETHAGPVRICNLHSWFVDENYRGHSLLLMRKAMQLRDCVLTDFSPTPPVVTISRRLGFERLDGSVRILFPLIHRSKRHSDQPEILCEPAAVRPHLSEPQQRILDDHPQCCHLLAKRGGEVCYIVAAETNRHWLPYIHIHHVSDPRLFAKWQTAIRPALLRGRRTHFAAIETRQFQGLQLPFSVHLRVQSNQIVRGNVEQLLNIDTLYSEVSLLRLTTLPGMRHLLSGMSRTCVPRIWGPQTSRLHSESARRAVIGNGDGTLLP